MLSRCCAQHLPGWSNDMDNNTPVTSSVAARQPIIVYVLTWEINEYDQHGEYFVDVFIGKPMHQQLTANGVPKNRLRHVLNGGGRVGSEDEWFWLKQLAR